MNTDQPARPAHQSAAITQREAIGWLRVSDGARAATMPRLQISRAAREASASQAATSASTSGVAASHNGSARWCQAESSKAASAPVVH